MKDFLCHNLVAILTFLSSLVLLQQLRVIWKQNKDDHDRSRRLVVIDLQKLWIERCDNKARFVRILLPKLNVDVSKTLLTRDSIEVDSQHKEIVCCLLDCRSEDLAEKNGKITISGAGMMKFRTHLANYLNLLEIASTAWVDNVGDREMIEREFGKLISSDNKAFELDPVIDNSDFLLSLKEFSAYLKERGAKVVDGKKKL